MGKTQAVLYHGTTAENAEQLLRERVARGFELWVTNEPGIAASYGHTILQVVIPADASVEAYPLRTGACEHMEDLFKEPAEFLVYHEGHLDIQPYQTI